MNPSGDRRKGIYVAVLNQGNIRTELTYILLEMVRQQKYRIFLTYPADKPIESNRNKVVKDFLERTEYDYLLMIDSDCVPPINVIDLADYQKDVIGGLCFAYRQGGIIPLVLKRNKRGSFDAMKIGGNEGLIECDAIGTGAIMISRKVLEDIRYPFKNYYDVDGIRNLGLDLSFCDRAKKKDYKVYCHLNFVCSHLVTMDLKIVYRALMANQNEELSKSDNRKGANRKRIISGARPLLRGLSQGETH